MTDEPIYEYVKGQGWVPRTACVEDPEGYHVCDANGRWWIVYPRPARVGEHWDVTTERFPTAMDYGDSFIAGSNRLGLSRATERDVLTGAVNADNIYTHPYTVVPADGVYDE
jgi:hypothetical protein